MQSDAEGTGVNMILHDMIWCGNGAGQKRDFQISSVQSALGLHLFRKSRPAE
jgi:hypothetical protein